MVSVLLHPVILVQKSVKSFNVPTSWKIGFIVFQTGFIYKTAVSVVMIRCSCTRYSPISLHFVTACDLLEQLFLIYFCIYSLNYNIYYTSNDLPYK